MRWAQTPGLRGLLLALLAPLALGQAPPEAEPRLVPDVSQRQVEIRYSFSGAELLLFGAILYPGGRTPEAAPDVAVVLKGPLQRIVLREKQKVAGIWMNVDRVRFRSAPGPGPSPRQSAASSGRSRLGASLPSVVRA